MPANDRIWSRVTKEKAKRLDRAYRRFLAAQSDLTAASYLLAQSMFADINDQFGKINKRSNDNG